MYYLADFFTPLKVLSNIKPPTLPKVMKASKAITAPVKTISSKPLNKFDQFKLNSPIYQRLRKEVAIPKYKIDDQYLTRKQLGGYLKKHKGWNYPDNADRWIRQLNIQKMQTKLGEINQEKAYKNLVNQYRRATSPKGNYRVNGQTFNNKFDLDQYTNSLKRNRIIQQKYKTNSLDPRVQEASNKKILANQNLLNNWRT